MVTLVDAKEALIEQFVTDWGATTPVTLDNEKFDPPSNSPWVRVVVRHRASNQESLGGVGNRKFQREGAVFVQVFGVINKSGSREADTLAQQARAVFEGKTISGIRIRDVIVREIGPDGSWYQINVEANFEYTERK